MTQSSNNITTLYISDPNGGQPQMIKVVGSNKLPIQFTSSSGSTVTPTISFVKTNSLLNEQGATLIQTGKIQNRPIIAVPAKQGVNVQGLRPVVVPVSNVQLKSLRNEQFSGIVAARPASTGVSSPMVIRTQTGSLQVASSPNSTSLQTSIHLPQINVSKQTLQPSNVPAVVQSQLKQIPAGTSTRLQSFNVKNQPSPKQSEFILVQQKSAQDSLNQHHIQTQEQDQLQMKRVTQIQTSQKHSSQLPSVNSPKCLMNTSILDHSGSRKKHDFDFDYSIESKRRKSEKGGKGLRHFSMKVCEKVQTKGTTSYNEVADELVNEFSDTSRSNSPSEVNYDQKNIRRRVYDALNVLMAMNIISKEKKEIRWLGLPTNSVQECHKLEQERRRRIQKIKLKTQQLQDLILQQIAFKNLVERNRRMEKENGPPSENSAIQLPFIIVNTSKNTVIDCSISNDKTEYLFSFDDTFEIHDDIEVLKRMGMALGLDKGVCTPVNLEKAKSLVPKALESYVTELAEGRSCDSVLESKLLHEDANNDDFESALNSMCGNSDFFGKIGSADSSHRALAELKIESMSRHSSMLSLSQDPRTDSASPSSFGDYDADNFDESDIEIG